MTSIHHKLVIGVSSSALFDLQKSDEVYQQQGVDNYAKYQIEHESDILNPGVGFGFVEKLLKLNQEKDVVEVILLSRNSADTGLRVFNSIQHYNLAITRAAFTAGASPYQYIRAFGAHLFISTNTADVKSALSAGCAAATLLHKPTTKQAQNSSLLRIAFDGDAVIFSDESERVFQESGLNAFTQHEQKYANTPLDGGPFKGFLAALHKLQQHFPEESCPIRTALVTARQAPAHERVIQTLRSWKIRIDEALFLGGLDKGEFLQAFQADIFFDDQSRHCESANQHVTTGHVPHGVVGLKQVQEHCEEE